MNKINLHYGNISRAGGIDATLSKPNGFDQWKGSSVYGKFDLIYYANKAEYAVCLSK